MVELFQKLNKSLFLFIIYTYTYCNAALDYTIGLESFLYIYPGLLEHN